MEVSPVETLSYYLRHKLDDYCLIEIFRNLNSVDLMTICDLDTENDKFFSNLIKHHVISKKLVCVFPCHFWRIEQTLETFGGMIRRLKVQTTAIDFIRLIRSIMTIVPIDTLIELQIEIRMADLYEDNRLEMSQYLLNEAIPYFRCLEALKIHDRVQVKGFERFVAVVMNNALNLRSLSLNELTLKNWLELLTESTYNLTELDLFGVDVLTEERMCIPPMFVCGTGLRNSRDRNEYRNQLIHQRKEENRIRRLTKILKKFPHLELFVCDEKSYRDCRKLQTELKKCYPRMLMISSRCIQSNFDNFTTGINDAINAKLTTIDPAGLDIKEELEMLATKNRFHELTIHIDPKRRIDRTQYDKMEPFKYPNGFASLHTLKLCGPRRYTGKNPNIDLFIRNVIRPMRSVKTIEFSSLRDIATIIDELEVIPPILDFRDVELESTDVTLIIQAIRNKFGPEETIDPIKVIVDDEEAEHFHREDEKVLRQFIALSVEE